jgi:hypothetical protein
MWWYIREKLRNEDLDLPDDAELFDDLTGPQMQTNDRGRQKLESKASMSRRGIKSPDLGDALAMAVYPWDWLEPAGTW